MFIKTEKINRFHPNMAIDVVVVKVVKMEYEFHSFLDSSSNSSTIKL